MRPGIIILDLYEKLRILNLRTNSIHDSMIPELRTLIAVSRYGTFAAAADRVGLTQSAVSCQIKRLEDHLGFPLFERTGRTARLNADGLRTLERARALVALFEELGDRSAESPSGDLRVGAIASAQSSLLAEALQPFREAFPNLRVHVVPGISMQLLDQVDAGDLDLALLIRPPFELPLDLEWKSLSREPYVLVAPERCAGRGWREVLQSEPFLRYARGTFGGRQIARLLRSLPFPVNEAIEVPMQAMLNMVQSDLGVALIPLGPGRTLPPGTCAIPLETLDLHREFGIVHPRAGRHPEAVDFLADCFARSIVSTGA
jgi:DNA-binding transcriptional LysR family regulator